MFISVPVLNNRGLVMSTDIYVKIGSGDKEFNIADNKICGNCYIRKSVKCMI